VAGTVAEFLHDRHVLYARFYLDVGGRRTGSFFSCQHPSSGVAPNTPSVAGKHSPRRRAHSSARMSMKHALRSRTSPLSTPSPGANFRVCRRAATAAVMSEISAGVQRPPNRDTPPRHLSRRPVFNSDRDVIGPGERRTSRDSRPGIAVERLGMIRIFGMPSEIGQARPSQ